MFTTEDMEEIDMQPKFPWVEPNWQEKLSLERTELEYALIRLNEFMARPDYKDIASAKQRELLLQQREVMTTLYKILGERICYMTV